MTNGGGKGKTGTAVAPGKLAVRTTSTSNTSNAAATSSNIPTRPKYRTRSSTGGAIKEEAEEEDVAEVAEGDKREQHSDAMAIDDEATTSRATGRQVKTMRKGAAAGPSKVVASTSTAPARRPLAAKKDAVNSAVSRTSAAAAGKAAVPKPTPAAVRLARRRVEEAEARHRLALEELEAAKRLEADELKRAALDDLEEDEGRRAKRQKTSEPERFLQDELEDEDEDVDNEGPRMSKWETEVEGGRPKDEGWEDLDECDEEDPLMVSTYVVEVYQYLRELEVRPADPFGSLYYDD